MSTSASPDMNITTDNGFIFYTASKMLSTSMSQSPLVCTSFLNLQNTQGNTQLIKQLGMQPGELLWATYLHRSLKSAQEESAMIIGAFPNLSALAAPILLPQITTLKHLSWRNVTTVSVCSASLNPKLMVSSYWLAPQPMKSKEARENSCGRYLMMLVDYNLEDELPCRYSMIQLFLYQGSYLVRKMRLP